MRLYIIRHADPDYPNHTITATGHREAEALSRRMQTLNLTGIFSSPMDRAVHTMRYTAARFPHIQPVTLDWTKELEDLMFRNDAGQTIAAWDIAAEEVFGSGEIPDRMNWHKRACYDRIDASHVFERVQAASDQWLASLGYLREQATYRCKDGDERNYAVFCHGGFGLTWLSHLLQLPPSVVWSGFWLPPSSVTTILFEQRSQGRAVPRCIGLGDVSHLYEAGLEVQPRGITANFY